MNRYLEMKRRQQQEVNDFPMMFAFSDTQFKEGMEKLGLTIDDTDKIYSIGGGGYIRKTDSKALSDMLLRHSDEMDKAIEEDTTGENFIQDMFEYELANHEYGYSMDIADTLVALGISKADLILKENLRNGLEKAVRVVIKEYNEEN